MENRCLMGNENMDRRHPSTEIVEIKETLKLQDEQLLRNEDRMIIIEKNLLANTQATLSQNQQIKAIADNTMPLVSLVTDLTAGTKFLCRAALGVSFALDKVDKFWKPSLFIFISVNLLLNHQLPVWITDVINFLKVLV